MKKGGEVRNNVERGKEKKKREKNEKGKEPHITLQHLRTKTKEKSNKKI